MLDIKTVMPKPYKRLIQLCDRNGNPTVLRVVKYDSEKCTVIYAAEENPCVIKFLLRGPRGEFFLQDDIYALGSVVEKSRTMHTYPLVKEDALSHYLFNLETGSVRLTLEEAFGVTAEEI